ncbi:hypothetical protein GFS24_17405 [Chitinophaga sp. SYP-B3965]|uniref:hypothetical protein n=1 Tax=Chitinophaga sp. SYP-B3965 TaxID=2663120 RepID=UPI001299A21C|nr:hypothetical protein [Chitinophaga sp. SYP-B3965]MRG46902.1 hypothetical protein [Chitinophaga sp. SYP-B3965]
MGTWGTGITDNDNSADIYDEFFEEFDKGVHPARISKNVIANNQDSIDSNDFWLALALAQWETGSLDPAIFTRVKDIVESKQDIELWRECDASDEDLVKRQKDLEEFIAKISVENANPKVNIKPKKPFWKFW